METVGGRFLNLWPKKFQLRPRLPALDIFNIYCIVPLGAEVPLTLKRGD